jgi:hypothetical protein
MEPVSRVQSHSELDRGMGIFGILTVGGKTLRCKGIVKYFLR